MKTRIYELWKKLTAWNGHIVVLVLLAGLLLVIRVVSWIFSGV